MTLRKRLITDTQLLTNYSKIELFNYINSDITSNYMENTNGIFFSLNEISDEKIELVINKINDLKDVENQEYEQEDVSVNKVGEGEGEEDIENVNVSDETNISNEKKTCISFEYNKNIVRDLDMCVNKVNKKSIHIKYSIAKKKYNKQYVQVETKKIDNNDIYELKAEQYIL